MSRLEEPDLEREGETLRSRRFGDIYFAPDDGLAETRHVFIEGSALSDRFGASPDQPFVIGELGFGTGLNLLAAWAARDKASGPPLHFWTVEGYPLSRSAFADAQEALAARWPELAPYAERLKAAYPEPVPGQVQVRLDETTLLTIAFGEVLGSLKSAWFEADAWFLDGFAPSRNPDMWTPAVFSEVARLSKAGATAATFSVAGGVRQALESAGFGWNKAPGFGRKKHMLQARLSGPKKNTNTSPFSIPVVRRNGSIAVIGAGIAGANLAHALRLNGWQAEDVTVFDPVPASGASGNPAGLIMPRVDADDSPAALFYRDAFLHARSHYRKLAIGYETLPGTLPYPEDKWRRLTDLALWPDGCMDWGEGALHVPAAGLLRPPLVIGRLLEGHKVETVRIAHLRRVEDAWQIVDDEGKEHGPFACVVLAGGAAPSLWSGAPIRPSEGQIDIFKGPAPGAIFTDGHYTAPLDGLLLTGATYGPPSGQAAPSRQNTETNRQEAERLLDETVGPPVRARVSHRATTPDRHPMAGPVFDQEAALTLYQGLAKGQRLPDVPPPLIDGLFVLGGLGSRGLVTSPLLANHLASILTGTVSPLTREAADLVHPGRFLIRQIKHGVFSP